MTGGGGFGAAVFFGFVLFFFFFVVGFLRFSTFDEPLPLDSAFPDESVGDLDFVVVVVGCDLVVVVGVVDVEVEEVGRGLRFDGVVELVEVEEVELEVEVVCGWVLVVTVVAGVVPVTDGQVVETLVIGRLTGSGSEVAGVPGATFWKVNCWPPRTVIV